MSHVRRPPGLRRTGFRGPLPPDREHLVPGLGLGRPGAATGRNPVPELQCRLRHAHAVRIGADVDRQVRGGRVEQAVLADGEERLVVVDAPARDDLAEPLVKNISYAFVSSGLANGCILFA